jgi:fructosamine-3-kinase
VAAILSINIVNSLNKAIEAAISETTGQSFELSSSSGMGGGCINNASRIIGEDGRTYFVKTNSTRFLEAFEAEARALAAMAETRTIHVPEPVCTCVAGSQAALVMEYLPMGRSLNHDWKRMGRELAEMHRHTVDQYGWDHDNFIGSTPQMNTWHANWIAFYRECRLMPQVKWARQRGLALRQADKLADALPAYFDSYLPVPSLLHGDLWSGNAGFLDNGIPVIFDPASYYGDRETDLAMSEMFGGYPRDFYDAYDTEWPIDSGYRQRKQLYILYHTLNHYNIFGGGYGHQAEAIISQLI